MMRWLLTYADMITLLLALFIILFSISTINKVKLQRLVHDLSGGFNSIDAINNPPEGGGLERAQPSEDLKQEEQILQTYIIQKHLQQQVKEHMTSEGLVISLLTDKALYDTGSAQLRPQTIGLLHQIGAILRRTQPAIIVRGYTDNEPIHTAEYPTNWELSAARADGVVRFLVEQEHLDPTKVSMEGYGEYHPTHTNQNPLGRQLNRRVDIVIVSAAPSIGEKTIAPGAVTTVTTKTPKSSTTPKRQ